MPRERMGAAAETIVTRDERHEEDLRHIREEQDRNALLEMAQAYQGGINANQGLIERSKKEDHDRVGAVAERALQSNQELLQAVQRRLEELNEAEPASEKRPRKPDAGPSAARMLAEDIGLVKPKRIDDEPAEEVRDDELFEEASPPESGTRLLRPLPPYVKRNFESTPRPVEAPRTLPWPKAPNATPLRNVQLPRGVKARRVRPQAAPLESEAEPHLELNLQLEDDARVPKRDDLELRPVGVRMRVDEAVAEDADVLFWRTQLSQLDLTDPANNERHSRWENKLRKAELVAKKRAATAASEAAIFDAKTAEEEAARTREMIALQEKMIKEERDAIYNAENNPHREKRLAYLNKTKTEIDALRAAQDEQTAKLLTDDRLSPETRAYIEEAARKRKEINLVGPKAAEVQKSITDDKEIFIPQHKENVARLEEELLELRSEAHRLELIQAHAERLTKTAKEQLDDAEFLLSTVYARVDGGREELPEANESGLELDVSNQPQTKKETLFEGKEDEEKAKKDKEPSIEPEAEELDEPVTEKLLSDLHDELLDIPEGKKYDAKRNLIADRIGKVELLLKKQKALEAEVAAKEEAAKIKKEIVALEARSDEGAQKIDAELERQADAQHRLDEARLRIERLREEMKNEPERSEEIFNELRRLEGETIDLGKTIEDHDQQIALQAKQNEQIEGEKDTAKARYHLAVDKWEAAGLALAALATKLEPFKHVKIRDEEPVKPAKEPRHGDGLGTMAKRAGVAGKKAGKFLGWTAIWSGVGVYGIVKGLNAMRKKIVSTFDEFEAKQNKDGTLSALAWLVFHDEKKKEE